MGNEHAFLIGMGFVDSGVFLVVKEIIDLTVTVLLTPADWGVWRMGSQDILLLRTIKVVCGDFKILRLHFLMIFKFCYAAILFMVVLVSSGKYLAQLRATPSFLNGGFML